MRSARLIFALPFLLLAGCGDKIEPSTCSTMVPTPAATTTASDFVDGSYRVTYALDGNALQTCDDDAPAGLSDTWTIASNEATSSIVGTFSFPTDGERVRGSSSQPSEGENANAQRVVKDIFAAFDAHGFSGTLVLSQMNDDAASTLPTCSNTFKISGARE